ncbi:hypothetical protein BDN70DRAFT_349863 [Pholiota conissans]|uniref:Uncharacterized protein n=1 Tax=Pholiota conissans TaxID=109636 RepID=A0A9P5Z9J3_9AGAR|nr:hypothetical protein BDN70DRAFT_349863 [Pholiota conissans]
MYVYKIPGNYETGRERGRLATRVRGEEGGISSARVNGCLMYIWQMSGVIKLRMDGWWEGMMMLMRHVCVRVSKSVAGCMAVVMRRCRRNKRLGRSLQGRVVRMKRGGDQKGNGYVGARREMADNKSSGIKEKKDKDEDCPRKQNERDRWDEGL